MPSQRFTLFGISIFFRMKCNDFLLTGRVNTKFLVNGIATMFESSFIGKIYVHPIISLHRLNEIMFYIIDIYNGSVVPKKITSFKVELPSNVYESCLRIYSLGIVF